MMRTYEEAVEMSKFKPTRTAIIRLAQNNPVIHHCLMLWGRGDITFEEAMMMSVVFLAERDDTLMEKLIEYKATEFVRKEGNNEF